MSDKDLDEKIEVFCSLDKAKILDYCNKYNITIPTDDTIFWAGVHKAICNLFLYEDSKVTPAQYNKSYDWLLEHGYTPSIEE